MEPTKAKIKTKTKAKTKRIAFTFDERSIDTLEIMTEEGHFSNLADTVRESLQVNRALQTQAKKGFTEIIVRNPETNEERIIVIPSLQAVYEAK